MATAVLNTKILVSDCKVIFYPQTKKNCGFTLLVTKKIKVQINVSYQIRVLQKVAVSKFMLVKQKSQFLKLSIKYGKGC